MKATTVASAVTASLGGLLSLIGLMMPNWRSGPGNFFLKDVEGVIDYATYPVRYYSPTWIVGTYRMAWSTLARSTCDNSVVIYGLSMADNLAGNTDWWCAGGGPNCPDNWTNHYVKRCETYKAIASISTATCVLTMFSFLMTMGCVFLIFLARLNTIKTAIFATLLFANFCMWGSLFMWLYFTSVGFTTLGLSATYPYPGVAAGTYVYAAACVFHLIGTGMFGVFKIFMKILFPDAGRPEERKPMMPPGAMQPGGMPPGAYPPQGGMPPGQMPPPAGQLVPPEAMGHPPPAQEVDPTMQPPPLQQ